MIRLICCAIAVFLVLALQPPVGLAEEDEAVMEEITVEATFDLRLDLPTARESAVQIMIDRLTLRAEMQRALDLQIANRTPMTTILDLTKYVPIPAFSGSSKPVDTFFQENYMRADLNPREKSPLFRED